MFFNFSIRICLSVRAYSTIMEIAETTNALDLIPSARLAVTHLLTRVVSVESLLTNSPVWFLSKNLTCNWFPIGN
jgi:hypothetical protein